MTEIRTLAEVRAMDVTGRRFHSANHEDILAGATTDVYFVKTREVLQELGLLETPVTAEVFPSRSGIMCGGEECRQLLLGRGVTMEAVPDGESFAEREVVLRVEGAYDRFGVFETALLGILASSAGWATAARECREAAQGKPFLSFGARHVHPAVAPAMERAAIAGGAAGASCLLGAWLGGREPSGTIPHAAILIAGDTLAVAQAYDRIMPPGQPRVILVDTFKDEAEESLRVAAALGDRLDAVRLDTPWERGGVTPELVAEVRARLDAAGHKQVKIFVSGGITPERMPALVRAGADAFGVGSYISRARPIDMTMDLKEIDGRPVAKRGRIPGRTPTPRLVKVI
ncbi:MAG: nicotinate phosphoribosyltransferase [bacterium]|nr:nicotinate phosphoribosyltransferase [bacterium]